YCQGFNFNENLDFLDFKNYHSSSDDENVVQHPDIKAKKRKSKYKKRVYIEEFNHPTCEFDEEELETLQFLHEFENLNKKLSILEDNICENVIKANNLSKQSVNFNSNHLKVIEEFFPQHSLFYVPNRAARWLIINRLTEWLKENLADD
ncbi:unnamed protein product, partial [Brachionus calyciflorus]